jgi:predicted nucleic acid-binding protein
VTPDPEGLLDTSVFIARESERPLDAQAIPDHVTVSVVTIAELQAGVLAAKDTETRSLRLATLEVLSDLASLPIDDAVAHQWARLRVLLAEAGRRVNVNDLWIAATAVANGLPVVTRDDDFDPLADLGVAVVKV